MPFGPMELVLILLIVLVIFGAGKLPQVFGSLGKGIKEFREASEGEDKTTVTTTAATPPPTTPPAGTTTTAVGAVPPPAAGPNPEPKQK